MSDLETALITTMRQSFAFHSVVHDYLTGCDCTDAQAFRQGKLAPCFSRHWLPHRRFAM